MMRRPAHRGDWARKDARPGWAASAAAASRLAEGTPFDETAPAGETRKEPAEAENRIEEKKAPAYKLFRFFDFSVEPGKQYVYRVCLALQKPQRGLKPAFLKNPELAKDTFLKTKWSDPSPAIAVPRDTRILLVSVKPPRPGGEPSGEILMTKWVEQTGAEVFKPQRVAHRARPSAQFPGPDGQDHSAAVRRAKQMPGGALWV